MNKKYSWSRVGQYPVEAQTVGEFIEGLPDQQPETFVGAAKSSKSPVHVLFPWNNSEAAHAHRLWLARQIFGSLIIAYVTTTRNKPATINVKAIHKVSRQAEYEWTETAFAQPDKRNYILAQALAQLRALKRRYASLSELALVFAALDKVAVRHRK